MEIRAEEISQISRSQIRDYEKKVEVAETGTVLSVGDGIARVHGVEKCMAMELLEFPGGIYGIVSEMEEGGTILLQIAEDVDIRIAQSAVARKTSGDLVAPAAQPAE